MKMTLKIFQNSEQVNEITSTDEKEIYKSFYKILHSKEVLKNAKTKINGTYNGITEVKQIFNYTGLKNITYTYLYKFEEI